MTLKTLPELRRKFSGIKRGVLNGWVKRGFVRADREAGARRYCEEDTARMCNVAPLGSQWVKLAPLLAERFRYWKSLGKSKELPSEYPLRKRHTIYCPLVDRTIEMVKELHIQGAPLFITGKDLAAIEQFDKANVIKPGQMTLKHRGQLYMAREALIRKHGCTATSFSNFEMAREFGKPVKVRAEGSGAYQNFYNTKRVDEFFNKRNAMRRKPARSHKELSTLAPSELVNRLEAFALGYKKKHWDAALNAFGRVEYIRWIIDCKSGSYTKTSRQARRASQIPSGRAG